MTSQRTPHKKLRRRAQWFRTPSYVLFDILRPPGTSHGERLTDFSVNTDPVLERIDQVLRDNRRIETLFIVLAVILFLLGIAAVILALATGKLVLASPSVVTTLLLYWPMKQIRKIRRENIALATAPALISRLPDAEAAAQIQRILENLFSAKE